MDDRGEEANVGEDIGQGAGSEGEDGVAGAEDRGKGLQAIRDAGDEEVRTRGEETGGVAFEVVGLGSEGP